MIKSCKRAGCPNTFDTAFTHPKREGCTPECSRLHRKAMQKIYNAQLQQRRKAAGSGRGRGRPRKETPERKPRRKGRHSQAWYNLHAVLKKHGIR